MSPHRYSHRNPVAALLLIVVLVGGCANAGDRTMRLLGFEDNAAGTGETAEARTVAVTGIGEPLAGNVLAHLSIAAEDCNAPRWKIRRLAEKADGEARAGLRALGYYQPEFVRVALTDNGGCWQANVSVSPGEPVLIKSVDIRLEGAGSGDPEFAAFLETLPLASGDVLNHGAYEGVKRSIKAYAVAHGFLDGEFVAKSFSVDVAARSAIVEIAYRPGRRYRYGRLHIDQAHLDPLLVEGLVAYEEGAAYDARDIMKTHRRLSESGYFESVSVKPRLEQRMGGKVPVDVVLSPRKKHSFTAGAGITTDAGPRLRLGYENRLVNPSGHRWSARSAASLIRRSLDTEYRVPRGDPQTEWLGLQAGVLHERTGASRSDTAKLGVTQTTKRWDRWLETRFASFSYGDFKVGGQSGTETQMTPGISLSTTRFDDRFRPTDGYRLHLEIRGSLEAALSDVTFLRVFGSAGWVRGMPWGGRVLARADLGAVAADAFDELPPSQRFFTGGDTTVRGYEFASLGPTDESGRVTGGRFLAVGSLEYEHPVKDEWSGALFFDAGNAFDAGNRNEGLKAGVGFGIRWQSPIGAVRLDLARPLDDSKRFRVHLRLGPDL